MLRNNADARRCSYFELGVPVVTRIPITLKYENNNILSHVKKNYEVHSQNKKRKQKEIRLCTRLIVSRNPHIFVTNLFDREF